MTEIFRKVSKFIKKNGAARTSGVLLVSACLLAAGYLFAVRGEQSKQNSLDLRAGATSEKQTTSPSIETVPTQTNNTSTQNPSASPSPSTATNPPISSYLPPASPQAPTCNEQLKASYSSKKDADIAYENSKHANYAPAAQPDSSYWANLMDQENARHASALATIASDYQVKLVSIHC